MDPCSMHPAALPLNLEMESMSPYHRDLRKTRMGSCGVAMELGRSCAQSSKSGYSLPSLQI